MGDLGEDLFKMGVAYKMAKRLTSNSLTCDNCGRTYPKNKGGVCRKGGWGCGRELCQKCAKICKRCKKVFCPKHIDSHGC
ncbi:MAG: hypothetical protein V1815_00225 [Candidatus Woesearchaeota archaeon]